MWLLIFISLSRQYIIQVKSKLWNYKILGYHNNKLWSFITSHELNVMQWVINEPAIFCFSISRLFREYWWYYFGYVKCVILYTGKGIQLTVCDCYSWEMELNFGLDISLDNKENWKRIRDIAREVHSTSVLSTSVTRPYLQYVTTIHISQKGVPERESAVTTKGIRSPPQGIFPL
jgi:hypothetical protein